MPFQSEANTGPRAYQRTRITTKSCLGYFQDVWSVTSPLTLIWGVRYYEFHSDAYKAGFPGMKTATEAEKKKFEYRRKENEWCPKARLDYEVDPNLTLYAAVSRETIKLE